MKHTLAVIGFGSMGSAHARKAREHDVFIPEGIWDILPERRAAAEAEGFRSFSSLEDLLSSPAEAVAVATPNDTHLALAMACLKAGKHVILEKPAALSPESLDIMIREARDRGLCLTTHQNRRWDGDFLAIRHLLQEGTLGPLIRVESRVHGSRGIPDGWRRYRAQGGGMIFDWGSHLIDQLLQFFRGQVPAWVSCEMEYVFQSEVDDGFRLEIGFADGVTALAEVSTSAFLSMPRFFVRGQRGSAMIRDWRECCTVAECVIWNERNLQPGERLSGPSKTMAPRDESTLKTYNLPRFSGDSSAFMEGFARAMEGRGNPPVTWEEMRLNQAVMAAAFESAASGAARIGIAL